MLNTGLSSCRASRRSHSGAASLRTVRSRGGQSRSQWPRRATGELRAPTDRRTAEPMWPRTAAALLALAQGRRRAGEQRRSRRAAAGGPTAAPPRSHCRGRHRILISALVHCCCRMHLPAASTRSALPSASAQRQRNNSLWESSVAVWNDVAPAIPLSVQPCPTLMRPATCSAQLLSMLCAGGGSRRRGLRVGPTLTRSATCTWGIRRAPRASAAESSI